MVKNDAGEMSMSEDSKQKAWLEHYQRLLNIEFNCQPRRDSTWLSQTWRRCSIKCLWRLSGGHWKNLVWSSGLCDWCRGCMPMRGAVSVLVRGTVKHLQWRSVFTKAQYSARCSSSICLMPCHASSTLGSPGKTSMLMTLLSSLTRSRNVSGGSWLGKKQ